MAIFGHQLATKKPSRLTKALRETADGMRRIGLLDGATHAKVTDRHLGPKRSGAGEPIGGEETRPLRKQAHLSQTAFARHLNLIVGYISQLERGTKATRQNN